MNLNPKEQTSVKHEKHIIWAYVFETIVSKISSILFRSQYIHAQVAFRESSRI